MFSTLSSTVYSKKVCEKRVLTWAQSGKSVKCCDLSAKTGGRASEELRLREVYSGQDDLAVAGVYEVVSFLKGKLGRLAGWIGTNVGDDAK